MQACLAALQACDKAMAVIMNCKPRTAAASPPISPRGVKPVVNVVVSGKHANSAEKGATDGIASLRIEVEPAGPDGEEADKPALSTRGTTGTKVRLAQESIMAALRLAGGKSARSSAN